MHKLLAPSAYGRHTVDGGAACRDAAYLSAYIRGLAFVLGTDRGHVHGSRQFAIISAFIFGEDFVWYRRSADYPLRIVVSVVLIILSAFQVGCC